MPGWGRSRNGWGTCTTVAVLDLLDVRFEGGTDAAGQVVWETKTGFPETGTTKVSNWNWVESAATWTRTV
jgi:hypothetical protein